MPTLENKISLYREDELSCVCYEQATVVPHWGMTAPKPRESGGVIDSNGEYVKSSVFISSEYSVRSPQKTEIVDKYEDVIFIGNFMPVFGHSITDGLKRFWFLYTDECNELLSQGVKLVYVTFFHGELKEWEKDVFSLAGIDIDECERVLTATRYRKVYVPDCSIIEEGDVRYYTQGYLDVVARMKKNLIPDNRFKKLYFTRSRIHNPDKDYYGEKDLEKVFEKLGYMIISPEEYGVKEQFQMAMGCEEFASTEGSCSHHSLFCPSGTKVTLLRKVNYVNTYQQMINQAAELNAVSIDVHNSIMARKETLWLGPFYMYVTPALIEYANYKGFVMPLWLRTSWWMYIVRFSVLGRIIRSLSQRLRCRIHNAGL